ncbi:MAG: phage major capsid protein [Mangrovicoccus sp.]
MKDINDLRRERTSAATKMEECANAIATLEEAETAADAEEMVDAVAAFDAAEAAFKATDKAVKRAEAVEQAKAASAQGDEINSQTTTTTAAAPAQPKSDADKGIEAGLMFQALAANKGDAEKAAKFLEDGGNSGVAATLSGAPEGAGGITIPRAQASELIELLRPRVAVRASGARMIDMPAGQMRHARQSSSATASYAGENAAMPVSEPGFDKVDQSFKKLTALVPVGNSLLRHSSVAMAALVRDDILKVMALREDLAFIRGDGTAKTPTGIKNWMLPENWVTGITNAPMTVDVALRGLVSKVEDANVGMVSCGWIMRAATKNFLASLRDPNGGNYLYPSIQQNGTLLGYPIKTTSQIPMNLGVGGNVTEVYFGDFDEVFIGDAMTLQFETSSEAAYVDSNGDTQSAFQQDLTLFRTISEHDLAPRHDEALSGLTGVNWTL